MQEEVTEYLMHEYSARALTAILEELHAEVIVDVLQVYFADQRSLINPMIQQLLDKIPSMKRAESLLKLSRKPSTVSSRSTSASHILAADDPIEIVSTHTTADVMAAAMDAFLQHMIADSDNTTDSISTAEKTNTSVRININSLSPDDPIEIVSTRTSESVLASAMDYVMRHPHGGNAAASENASTISASATIPPATADPIQTNRLAADDPIDIFSTHATQDVIAAAMGAHMHNMHLRSESDSQGQVQQQQLSPQHVHIPPTTTETAAAAPAAKQLHLAADNPVEIVSVHATDDIIAVAMGAAMHHM